jgi:hypothetical protein
MYSYVKCIVYDKLFKPRKSFQITLYLVPVKGRLLPTTLFLFFYEFVLLPGNGRISQLKHF